MIFRVPQKAEAAA